MLTGQRKLLQPIVSCSLCGKSCRGVRGLGIHTSIHKLGGLLKGHKLSEATKQKIRERMMQHKSFKGHKHSETTKQKIREQMTLHPPFRGHKHSEATKQKISLVNNGRKLTFEQSQKKSLVQRGRTHSEGTKQKMRVWQLQHSPLRGRKYSLSERQRHSKVTREYWVNLSPEKRRIWIKNTLQRRGLTKPELIFSELIAKWGLPYAYVGDGRLIIGRLNPDFANVNGKKKLIEVFGDYWHKSIDEQIRSLYFARFGYQTLVVWEHELSDPLVVKKKLLEFEKVG